MCEFSSENSVNYLNEVLFKEYDQWKWTNCKTDVQTDKPITNLMYKQINQSKTWYTDKWTNHEPDVHTNEPITNLVYRQRRQISAVSDSASSHHWYVVGSLPIEVDVLILCWNFFNVFNFWHNVGSIYYQLWINFL